MANTRKSSKMAFSDSREYRSTVMEIAS
jgi:hypothetical protein